MKKSYFITTFAVFLGSCSYTLSQQEINNMSSSQLCMNYSNQHISPASKHMVYKEMEKQDVMCEEKHFEALHEKEQIYNKRQLSNLIVDSLESLGRIFKPY